ncbi:MAG: hypothetical protein KJS83_07795 [Xanthomonadaceae bacterium]|nr:hypothetical protein [Xanthomonadaceae bacterium]
MELDDFKHAWAETDSRLDGMEALLRADFRERRLDRARGALRPLWWGQVLQLMVGVAFSIGGGTFWATHFQPLHLLVCGLLVHAFGLLLIVFAARNLYLISRVDYAAPVVDIQRRIAGLRAFRMRVEAPVNAALGCFIWIPVLWMNLAWYGIDLWSPGFAAWALACGLAGLVAVVVVVWAMRQLGYGHKIENESAGRSVVRAQAVLDEIVRFERE